VTSPSSSERDEAPQTSKVTKLPSATPRAKRRQRGPLPDDLLFRSDEEAARRLALKSLAAAVAAERRLDDRYDKEALHDFRVAVRRLRSVLRAYRPQLEGAVRPKDRKRLRTIQRATGAGREAEVALKWLTKQQGSLRPEHLPGLNWLSATLMERRRRCHEDLDEQIRGSFRRLAERLEERLAIMRTEQNLLSDASHASFARCAGNLAEAHATELLVTLGQIASMDDSEKLHDGRIAGKRLRYLLEPIRPYLHGAQQVVKQSKRLQDVLGDLNDISVLQREINGALEASTLQRGRRIRDSLHRGDYERASRESAVTEWTGLLELYQRLEEERRDLVAKLRDRWFNGDLDALISKTRDLAQQLRSMDQPI